MLRLQQSNSCLFLVINGNHHDIKLQEGGKHWVGCLPLCPSGDAAL